MRVEVAQERRMGTTPQSAPTGWEIVVIDERSRFVGISDRARRWLKDYFPGRDTLFVPDRIRRWIADQRSHLNAAGLENGGHTAPLVVERPDRRLVVTMLPDRAGITLVLAEERTAFDAISLRSLGLSARETEVLYWVSRGRTNAEVAAILDIRPRTVGKHLERIYEQLGVENRTAAASRALESLASDRL
jgi:DNA-binding CsgD family transcriptional regulator